MSASKERKEKKDEKKEKEDGWNDMKMLRQKRREDVKANRRTMRNKRKIINDK